MLSNNNEPIEVSIEANEKKLLELIAKRYYDQGYLNGYSNAQLDARIDDIATIIKNTGQEIFARKFLNASSLELTLATQKLGLGHADQIQRDLTFEAAQNARLGKQSLHDWQWI